MVAHEVIRNEHTALPRSHRRIEPVPVVVRSRGGDKQSVAALQVRQKGLGLRGGEGGGWG